MTTMTDIEMHDFEIDAQFIAMEKLEAQIMACNDIYNVSNENLDGVEIFTNLATDGALVEFGLEAGNFITSAWEALKKICMNVYNAIKDLLKKIWNFITGGEKAVEETAKEVKAEAKKEPEAKVEITKSFREELDGYLNLIKSLKKDEKQASYSADEAEAKAKDVGLKTKYVVEGEVIEVGVSEDELREAEEEKKKNEGEATPSTEAIAALVAGVVTEFSKGYKYKMVEKEGRYFHKCYHVISTEKPPEFGKFISIVSGGYNIKGKTPEELAKEPEEKIEPEKKDTKPEPEGKTNPTQTSNKPKDKTKITVVTKSWLDGVMNSVSECYGSVSKSLSERKVASLHKHIDKLSKEVDQLKYQMRSSGKIASVFTGNKKTKAQRASIDKQLKAKMAELKSVKNALDTERKALVERAKLAAKLKKASQNIRVSVTAKTA